MTKHLSRSESETRRIARSFAGSLQLGDVVALYGELGSGKTQFVKGICEAFGIISHVASPTFVIQNRYEGKSHRGNNILLYHFDLYRLNTAEEVYDLGYEEFFFGDGICMVEWAERLGQLLPTSRYDVILALGKDEDVREISIEKVIPVGRHEGGKVR